jgi:ataxia telangiectasia mutated family protein
MSEARLEKPDKIMSQYLEKAIAELGRDDAGSEAGRVFHEFANFCDQQLQNPNNIEDYERALKLRQDKEAEVRELEKLIKAGGANKDSLNRECHKAKSWLALDDAEYARLKENREAFLEKSVLNYLRCLAACDDYDGDAVRFSSLWLANSADDKINAAASILRKVASRKFVSLMNQLSSRLLNTTDEFQRLLLGLIFKICQDHPYHGIYQILALSKTRTKDNVSILRQAAAVRVTTNLQQSKKSEHVVSALETTTRAYERLAHAKVEKKTQPRGGFTLKFVLKDNRERANKYERDIPSFRIPPPTMHIEVRADCDYSKLPVITRYDQGVSLASGLSVPKIIKCEASDGTVFKQLVRSVFSALRLLSLMIPQVKGGSDDLRQDAIMEQVFEQVSVLLQKGRITRQRNLKIRTYKVIPLSASSGIIEFVPNTIPLHEWLIPAHQKYHPKDWTQPHCRKVIADVQSKSRESRIAEFQRVLRHYQPVMHYFFMHDFNGPDKWFSSRLAYTRSTAAISILGHVLGLGDRHGHNILLDTKTGEVVHIDLGVAFEQACHRTRIDYRLY